MGQWDSEMRDTLNMPTTNFSDFPEAAVLLQLSAVSAGYGLQQSIFTDFSLTLGRGQSICLYGPSGSGKTTALLVAAGLLKPRHGTVQRHASRQAFVFQDDCLLPWRDARSNIVFALRRHYAKAEAGARADYWLERFGLHHDRHKFPGSLSGGMRRRVNLARALASTPDLLFLDEAFSFLDEQMLALCLEAIMEWQQTNAGAILAVTHDLTQMSNLQPQVLTWPPNSNS